ncbi:MAG: threonine--tRNA ligase [Nanoarchaeota archaeon]
MKYKELRHSAAHVLAQAVKSIYPDVKLAIGPPTEDGFYYDFESKKPFTPDDLENFEKKMQEIINKNYKFVKSKKTRKEAENILRNEPYKLELLRDLPDDNITFYTDGDFVDLCAGPHVSSTGDIKAFKLLKIAGAYWRGDSRNKQLQRIYGTAFLSKKELDEYLKMLQEAEKRDHRKLGEELELFFFSPVAPGAPFWLPKGMIIFKELERYWREIHDTNGYFEISTPIMVKEEVFKKSGHATHYAENMFGLNVEKEQFYLKPMNCPEGAMVYSSRLRSYRDLPIRLSEIGRLHRNELMGVLGGMFRVRQITMDDAHLFCTEEQLFDEISNVIKIIKDFYKLFELEPKYFFSTMPDKALGDVKIWQKAEKALEEALKKNKLKYEVKEKEGAFYGPKIDIYVTDSLGREWQLATIQLDFNLCERFNLTYEGKDGRKHRPVVIHRAIFGSFERFIGILIEHYAGKFPLWLSPIQVKVLTLTDKNKKYAKKIYEMLKENRIRVELDDRPESMGRKVRDAQLEKIPYVLTVGDKEEKNKGVAVRTRDGKIKFGVKIEKFLKYVLDEIEKKV